MKTTARRRAPAPSRRPAPAPSRRVATRKPSPPPPKVSVVVALPGLLHVIRSEDDRSRGLALGILKQSDHWLNEASEGQVDEIIGEVISLLDATSVKIRRQAAGTLGSLKSRAAAASSHLFLRLTREIKDLEEVADLALFGDRDEVQWQARSPETSLDVGFYSDLRGAIRNVGAPAVATLLDAIHDRDEDENLRFIALDLIREIRPRADVLLSDLSGLIETEEGPLRALALKIVAALGDAAASMVPVVAALIRDESENLSKDVAEDVRRETSYLIRALFRTLERIGGRSVPELVSLLEADAPLVRTYAVEALQSLAAGTPEVEAALERRLRDREPAVSNAAAGALERMRRSRLPP